MGALTLSLFPTPTIEVKASLPLVKAAWSGVYAEIVLTDMWKKKSGYILAIDIGGTKLAAAVFDNGFKLVCRSRVLTHAEEGPDAVFARLVRFAESLMGRCGVDAGSLRCVGVGCVGPLDSDTGVVYSPPNLPGWHAFPLKEKLEKHFGFPAFVDNDANAAALAEQRFGAGRGYKDIFYMTISTGIGAGIILDGKIYRGANFSAGEFGHLILARNGPNCNCGGRGCFEALASGTAIAKRAKREAGRAPNSLLARRLAEKGGGLTAKDVADAARRGDSLSKKIFLDAAVYVGLGVTSVVHLLNPEIVIIGGGLSRAGRLLFDPVRRTVAERAQEHFTRSLRIVPAELGAKVGVYGALSVALERHPSYR